jgi:hypothetical protein
MLISEQLRRIFLTVHAYTVNSQPKQTLHYNGLILSAKLREGTSTGCATSLEVTVMTEYAPASSRDRNSFCSNPHLVTPHYTNGNGVNYFYPQGQLPLTGTGTYASYTPVYASSPQPNTQSPMYMANNGPTGVPYSLAPPARPYPMQSRTLSFPPYHNGIVPTQRAPAPHQLRRAYHPELTLSHVNDIESQDSINEDTKLSEPILPPLEGYPGAADFDGLMVEYGLLASP